MAKKKVKAKARRLAKGSKAKKEKKAARKSTGSAPRETIASVVRALLDKNPNVSDDVVIGAVRKKFPDAKTGPKNISWYRWKWQIKRTK